MKRILTICIFSIVGLLSTSGTTRIPPPGLDHTLAKSLISKALKLPRPYRHYLPARKTMCWGNDVEQLQKDGLLTYTDDPNNIYNFSIKVDPMFAHMYLGQDAEGYHMFQLYDIVFGSITGVSTDPNTQLATVRFSLAATNITVFASSLSKVRVGCSGRPYIPFKLYAPINGELVFRKFDTGWQLESMQNKGAYDILKEIYSQNKM